MLHPARPPGGARVRSCHAFVVLARSTTGTARPCGGVQERKTAGGPAPPDRPATRSCEPLHFSIMSATRASSDFARATSRTWSTLRPSRKSSSE